MNLRNRFCVAVPLMATAPAAQAQQWLVNNAINNQIVETAICDSGLKKGEKLPSICAKYPKYSRAVRPSNPTPQTPQALASAKPRAAGSGKFVPNPGDDSLRKLADSVGSTEQERQQLRQVVQAGNTLFEQKYGAKGWKNDLAGAFAFFIVSISTVYNDQEPDGAAQDRVFDALGTTLGQAPDIAKLSNKDRTALYNTLIAAGGLPLLFYADGKQQNNAAEVEQAKAMAIEFSRKILNTEPQALAAIGQ
ncbi:DUF6683 family protein [Sphingomonas mali]|uniref:DUF6683 family protein n=1 Tax=Sphingomonas mali TaxID=40682 RepID=UPI000829F0FC|nr:DUF6683 family protein [Sphingomonas mali]